MQTDDYESRIITHSLKNQLSFTYSMKPTFLRLRDFQMNVSKEDLNQCSNK